MQHWPAGTIAPEDEQEFEQQRRSLHYERVGNEPARILVDLLQPRLVVCGHTHRRYRANHRRDELRLPRALLSGADAFAVFERTPAGEIIELTAAPTAR
ncbi:metallophosphoesterase family protein [Enhygromyxa salina]|uniref:Calcineurin-like phosphoesterase domain-containing protein n=1 Tax=Enhygromyxa salina TaxID=215803 RepID=A0A2S9YVG8_9BACT|nr:metallophosphoesterase family protein [Enhygromyxa salina]PRQ09083.1 hypothetical protein ENSA7_10730 [Enhygromyxa salina]